MPRAERRAAERLPLVYRVLLHVYPPRFRKSWSHDLEETFIDLAAEARRTGGRLGALRFTARASLEAIWRGLSLRLGRDPGSRVPASPDSPGGPVAVLAHAFDVAGHELRAAYRGCLGTRLTSGLAVLVFAVGIGANTIVYSVVGTALIRELPFPHDELLVDANMVADRDQFTFAGGSTVSVQIARAWRDHAAVFEKAAIYTSQLAVLTGHDEPAGIWVHYVTHDFLALMGAQVVSGRTFGPEADGASADRVVVIGEAMRRRHFDVDEQVLGATLRIDDTPYEVIGILADGFRFPANMMRSRDDALGVWVPFGLAVDRLTTRDRFQGGCLVVGRLRVPTPTDSVVAELDRLVEGLGEDRGDAWASQANVTPLRKALLRDTTVPLLMLQGAVALVLLIACANVANLLLARGIDRERELHLRAALGAGRGRLALRVVFESGLLAGTGALLGVTAAYTAFPLILRAGREALPKVGDFRIDAGVLGAVAAAAVLAAGAASAGPALRAGYRRRERGLMATGASHATTSRSSRASRALIVAQVSLALVLLTGASLLLRTLAALVQVDTGFDAEHLVVTSVDLPEWAYPDAESQRTFARALMSGLGAIPGATEFAVSTGLPLDGGMISTVTIARDPDREEPPWAHVNSVSAGYFDLFGLEFLAGEPFVVDGEEPMAVINATAARVYFEDQALGEQFSFGGSKETFTVVGVVNDVLQDSLRNTVEPQVYVPLTRLPDTYLKAAVRIRGDEALAAVALRRVVRSSGPEVPINQVTTMERRIGASLGKERFYTTLLVSFAAAALLIACTGIFGVTSHIVSRGRREVGVRMALGATPRDILGLVVRRGLGAVLVGALLGIAGAVAATRILQSLLFGVEAIDAMTFAAATALVLTVATVAAWLPARRAAATDPALTMRAD